MADVQKITKMEFFNSLKLANFLFSKRTKYVLIYILLIPGMYVLRGFMNIFESEFRNYLVARDLLNTDGIVRFSIAPCEMVIFMLTKIWYWNIEIVCKMTFEFLITPIGSILVRYILHKILMAEDPRVNNISPSNCEYTMTEGGKSLAKIVRLIFIGLVDCIISICADFKYIHSITGTENKTKIVLIFASFFLIAFLKLIHLNRIFYLVYATTQVNAFKEKIYVETIDALPIVKSSREEGKMITRYQMILEKWKRMFTTTKLLEYTNTFIFTIAFDSIIAITMIIFVNDISKRTKGKPDFAKLCGTTNNYQKIMFRIPSVLNTMIKFYRDTAECVVLSQKLLEYLIFVKEDSRTKISIESFNEKIEIKDLVYSTKDKLVFSGVDFTINKGDKIALVGRNGSGKSSIFKLILGFDEFKGSITIDDIDIKRLDMPAFRSLITYVPQDTKLFDETIFYNLTFGNNKPFDEVIKECQRMQIHDIIMTFPNGYNTVVGEDGKILNGGLRQKIFYTRAFLRDTEIYMFDEPTNNLDLKHSQFLLEYLKDPKYENKTFFVICHDHSIVRKFPKILHFEEGKIKEVETI